MSKERVPRKSLKSAIIRGEFWHNSRRILQEFYVIWGLELVIETDADHVVGTAVL